MRVVEQLQHLSYLITCILSSSIQHLRVRMPHYNIQWKGYPHHRLPGIRLASTATNKSCGAQAAAENVVRLPFGLALEKARTDQVCRHRPRRKANSRGSSSLISRRQAILKARQEIKTRRWKRSCTEFANTSNKEEGREDSWGASYTIRDSTTPSRQLQRMTDGTTYSKIRAQKLIRLDSSSSSMQVTTPYYGDLPKDGAHGQNAQQTSGEYTHVASIDMVHVNSAERQPQSSEKTRIQDARPPIKDSAPKINQKSTVSRRAPSIHSRKSSVASKRSRIVERPPRLREAVRKRFEGTVPAATLVASEVSSTVMEDPPLRSPSRQMALDNFSRGLEKHLIAHQALRAASLATSASCVSVSAHTIKELLPYVEQFRASGLAVTTSDQRHHSPEQGRSLPAPPTPRKDSRYAKETLVMSKIPETGPEGSSRHCSTSSDSASSCTTIITFPPFAASPPLNQSVRKTPAKKVLPWLRKERELSCKSESDDRAVSSATKLNFTSEQAPSNDRGKGKEKAIGIQLSSQVDRHGEIRWSNPDYSSSATHRPDGWRTYSDTPPNVRNPLLQRAQPLRSGRAPPPLIPTQRSPLQGSRNQSTSNGPESSPSKDQLNSHRAGRSRPGNPSERLVSRLPMASFSAPYDHENPSIFEETLNEVVKAFDASESRHLEPKLSADIEIPPTPLPVTTDPVKRAPASPYIPPIHRHLDSIRAPNDKRLSYAETWETLCSEDLKITERDVLKGLQVALAAACDEHVDDYIKETTGRSIRRLLAKLGLLDELGINELTTAARRIGQKRSNELKAAELNLGGGGIGVARELRD